MLVELDVPVEFVDVVEVVVAAARTRGDARIAAAIAIAAMAVSCAVLVFIFRRLLDLPPWYLLNFRDYSAISTNLVQEGPTVEEVLAVRD